MTKTTSNPSAIIKSGKTLPVLKAKVKAVETAGGCITFKNTIKKIETTIANIADV